MQAKLLGLRVITALVVVIQFYNLVAWVSAKPIDAFSAQEFTDVQIPSHALSFSIHNDAPVFYRHATAEEDPLNFALTVGVFLATMLVYRLAETKIKRKETSAREERSQEM